MLAAAGYDTYAFVTNPNLTEASGFSRGFGVYDYELKADAATVNEAALRWLRARPANDPPPVFMFLHYNEPHDSYYGSTFDYRRMEQNDLEVERDPFEQNDLSRAQAARAAELSARLDAHAARRRPPPPAPPGPPTPGLGARSRASAT